MLGREASLWGLLHSSLTNHDSDARSAQVVDERLRPALESGSAVGSSKPVLAVIDEIDGATGGSDHVSTHVCIRVRC